MRFLISLFFIAIFQHHSHTHNKRASEMKSVVIKCIIILWEWMESVWVREWVTQWHKVCYHHTSRHDIVWSENETFSLPLHNVCLHLRLFNIINHPVKRAWKLLSLIYHMTMLKSKKLLLKLSLKLWKIDIIFFQVNWLSNEHKNDNDDDDEISLVIYF